MVKDEDVSNDSPMSLEQGADAGGSSSEPINLDTANTPDTQPEPSTDTENYDFKHAVIKQEVMSDSESVDNSQLHDDSIGDNYSRENSFGPDDDSNIGTPKEGFDSSGVDLSSYGLGVDPSSLGLPMGPVRFGKYRNYYNFCVLLIFGSFLIGQVLIAWNF